MPDRKALRLLPILLLGALLSSCGSSTTSSSLHVTQLATGHAANLSLTDAWVLAPEDGGGMADMPGMSDMDGSAPMVAAYGVLHNDAGRADALTGVTAPDGAHAQLHVTTQGTTSGTMKEVADLGIPAGGERRLAPGGAHVMITGLRPVPKAGETVRLTFVFRSGARISATLPVISAENRPS